MKLLKDQCARCGGGVPTSEQPGAYPGALSRVDNSTYICSECGVDEAMLQFAGVELTKERWYINKEECSHSELDWEGPDESVGIFGFDVWCKKCEAQALEFTEDIDEEHGGVTFNVTKWGFVYV